ncbi:MAG: hypothetical protein ABIE68_02635 [bacterium]
MKDYKSPKPVDSGKALTYNNQFLLSFPENYAEPTSKEKGEEKEK